MIIVTGASRGLGLSICDRLYELGHSVIGLARNIENLPSPSFKCDVSIPDDIKNVAKYIKENKIVVDGLINVAGIASMNLLISTPLQTIQNIINTNLLGTIYCCQYFAPFMIRNKSGTIINFSTIAVPLGLSGESIYIASKSGIEGFTKSFAREVSSFNINVNCISPGPINTDLIKGVSQDKINDIINKQIIKRQFSKNDICDIVELLLNKKSKSLSGQIFHIGGV